MQIVPEGTLGYGVQLPVQAQSTLFLADWEKRAGPDEIIAVATAADESGFLWVAACEHIGVPEHRAVSMSTFWSDPVAVLSMVAGVTTRVRLMTYVYLLALRHPLMAAKSLSTLDYLSKGRLIVGVGAGHVEEEFDALGVDFATRGTALTRSIEALKAAFASEYPTLPEPFDAHGCGLQPRPVQHPRPPIFVAGSTEPAMRRAARHADGWLPQSPATAAMIDLVTTERQKTRPGEPMTLGHIAGQVYVGTPSWDVGPGVSSGRPEEIAERLLQSTPEGANMIHVMFKGRSCEEFADQVRAFGSLVGPLLKR